MGGVFSETTKTAGVEHPDRMAAKIKRGNLMPECWHQASSVQAYKTKSRPSFIPSGRESRFGYAANCQ
ncbi:MAG: hypothetical protein JWM16_4150 [Verrucomicrobiales bacterium]|nr:hypothetical protein [Verrucomicrobiales bacterium]